MQEKLPASSANQKYQWLNKAEVVSIAGSVIGAVASVAINQAAIAAIPLSVTVTLNLMNRRFLLESMKQNNLDMISQVIQEQVKTQTDLETLTTQLSDFEQKTHQKHTELHGGFSLLDDHFQQLNTAFNQAQDHNQQALSQIQQENQTQLEALNEHLEHLQQQTNKLVQEQSNKVMNEQAKIAKTVDALRDIETCTQSLRINPTSANAFFNRGLSYQRLGDREAAIGDYSEAIKINPNYAEAYQSRGLSYADIGDKKTAVKDLREAARLFFESGEIEKYQIARDISKKFYDIDVPDEEAPNEIESFDGIALESLFS